MSLLDDVSIVVTPNGYKAGELYAVVPVPTEGADVVVDGDFPLPNTAWSLTNATVEVNGARVNNTIVAGFAAFSQLLSGTVIGKQFVLTYDVIATNGKDLVLDNSTSLFLNTSTTGINRKLYYTWGRGDNYLVIKRAVADTDVTIDNVILQEYTAADMDVTRASAATRVDENGLVNYAEIVGSEEVTNGDFATDSDWSKASNWTISGGSASSDGVSAISNLSQTVVDFTGKTFLVEGVASNITQGFAYISLGGSDLQIVVDSNGAFSHTISISTANSTLFISARNNFIGSIDNVSVKEVTRDNVPRIDYSGGGCPHILAEPQRTNLVTESSDFNDSSWNADGSNLNLTRTPNAATSPSGENDATKLIPNNTSKNPSTAYIQDSTGATEPYVSSLFAKKGEYDYLISTVGTYNGGYWASFNLANGTVNSQPTQVDTTASIEDFGNGWYRCLITTTSTGGLGICLASPSVDGTISTNYTNTTNGIYIWGAQLEVGSYPTSYIPTSGSTVTRVQDQFSRDGISSLINSTEGVLFVEFKTLTETGVFRQFNLSKDSGNRIYITKRGDSGNLEFRMENPSGNLNFSFSENTTNDFVKVAFRYGLNNFAVFIDGVNKNVTATGNVFASGTLNTLEFDSPLGQPFYGKVKQLQVYSTALSDEQLIQLTGTSGTDFYESYAAMASALTYTIQ